MEEKPTNRCRICLLEIVKTEQYYFINNDNELKLQFKLLDFLPEIDLNLTPNPIACNSCKITIEEIYEFKQLGIRTETTMSLRQAVIKEEFLDDNITSEGINKDCLEVNTDMPTCIEEPSEPKLYYCFDKDLNLDLIFSLKSHMRKHNKKLFKCNICDYCSNHVEDLERHMGKHINEKPLKCKICDNFCITKSVLKSNRCKHIGEKPYKCNICDYCSSDMSQLKLHILEHTGEKPYKCNTCDYCSTTKSKLQIHLQKHTGEKPFRCNVCDCWVTTKGVLKRHMLTHMGEKPFKCNICDFCSIHKFNLKRHMRRHTR
ncbi:hypothetical protein RN001_015348 [Aquatica leii]|uniref:C2H2-type domain-containing protein n=1 Tax=Aquatica leii TaxID=1421715 RepID=A0AAN7PPJ2_9COLE|nr:hypothetical protein RN001_015348 [Aquatica leii]